MLTTFQVKFTQKAERIASSFSVRDNILIKFTHTKRARCCLITNKEGKYAILKVQKEEGLYYRGWQSSLCHEMAHALDFLKNNHVGHTGTFPAMLEKVVKLFFYEPREYNWQVEYNSVQEYGRHKGYLKREDV